MNSIRQFVKSFGGLEEVVQFIALGVLVFLLIGLVRRRAVRWVLSMVAAVVVLAQLISLYFTQEFIGYQFYVHLSTRGTSGLLSFYHTEILLVLVLLAVCTLVFYHSRTLFEKIPPFLHRFAPPLARLARYSFLWVLLASIGLIVVLARSNGLIEQTHRFATMLRVETADFSKALNQIGMTDYTRPEELRASPGKNFIILSLESFERGYLHDRYADLTPGLRDLQSRWTYLPIEENTGSRWTSGALYTLLTGFPAYFGRTGNDIFQGTYHSSVASIGHTLSGAGYELSFINDDVNYSGTREMLFALGIEEMYDRYNLQGPPLARTRYSSYDYDLFAKAKSLLLEKRASPEPFGIIISTLDTHTPVGRYDARMERWVAPREDELEFMVAAVDHLVTDLIHYLDSLDMLETTTVLILPDHLKMGNGARFDGTGSRGLYLLTNAEPDALQIDSTTTYYQVHLPRLVLQSIGVEHNQHFLSDVLTEDAETFISRHREELVRVNTAGLLRVRPASLFQPTESPNTEAYRSDMSRFIAHAGGGIDGHRYTNSLEAMDLNYALGYRLFELDLWETSDGHLGAVHSWPEWAQISGYNGAVPPSRADFLSHRIHEKYTPLDMDRINQWFADHPDATLVTDKIRSPDKVLAVFDFPKRLLMEIFTKEGLAEALRYDPAIAMPNLTLVRRMGGQAILDADIRYVAAAFKTMEANPDLTDLLHENGVRIYGYGLHHYADIDEDYVVRFGLDRFHGLYVDFNDFRAVDSTGVTSR